MSTRMSLRERQEDSGHFRIKLGTIWYNKDGVPYMYRGWTQTQTVDTWNHHFIPALRDGKRIYSLWNEYRAVKLVTLKKMFPHLTVQYLQ